MKVLTAVGTRPEIIRLSRIIPLLDKYSNHILVHTGQNYDYKLNKVFFEDLGLRDPDYVLNIDTTTLGSSIAGILQEIEGVILKEKPDAFLVLGDTNSSLSAIIARRLKIPIYHIEAGNRAFDPNVPEEINRKIVDHLSDFNLVYTEHARRNLLYEGFPTRRILLCGSPLKEVIDYFKPKIEKSSVLNILNLIEKDYLLISVHREENVDNKENLKKIFSVITYLIEKYNKKAIISTHPRTRDRMRSFNLDIKSKKIKFLDPFGYFDYLKLQINAYCTLSDSGSISEEAMILNFPAITLRKSTERPEALEAGTIALTGFDTESVENSIKLAIEFKNSPSIHPHEYLINNTSERILKLITSTCKLSNLWDGIQYNDVSR